MLLTVLLHALLPGAVAGASVGIFRLTWMRRRMMYLLSVETVQRGRQLGPPPNPALEGPPPIPTLDLRDAIRLLNGQLTLAAEDNLSTVQEMARAVSDARIPMTTIRPGVFQRSRAPERAAPAVAAGEAIGTYALRRAEELRRQHGHLSVEAYSAELETIIAMEIVRSGKAPTGLVSELATVKALTQPLPLVGFVTSGAEDAVYDRTTDRAPDA